jgi:hypothetical protein
MSDGGKDLSIVDKHTNKPKKTFASDLDLLFLIRLWKAQNI